MEPDFDNRTQEQLRLLADDLFGDTLGVLDAMRSLSKDFDKIKLCIVEEEYAKASAIGYESLSTHYVFLQRCLGGFQSG